MCWLLLCDNCIVDVSVIGNLECNVLFFVFSMLIIFVGIFILLGFIDCVVLVLVDLLFVEEVSWGLLELKLLCLVVVFVYVFFIFSWCMC